jgi:hypothetical protein
MIMTDHAAPSMCHLTAFAHAQCSPAPLISKLINVASALLITHASSQSSLLKVVWEGKTMMMPPLQTR